MTEELLERLIEVVNDLRSPTLTDWLLAAVPGLALVVTWLLWWRDRRTLLGEIETGRQREARAVQPTVFVVTDEHKVGTLLLGKKRRAETWAYSRVRLHNLGP